MATDYIITPKSSIVDIADAIRTVGGADSINFDKIPEEISNFLSLNGTPFSFNQFEQGTFTFNEETRTEPYGFTDNYNALISTKYYYFRTNISGPYYFTFIPQTI